MLNEKIKNNIKFFGILFVIFTIFTSILTPKTAIALSDYKVLVQLPGIGDNDKQTTNFNKWLPNAFNLTVAISAGLAFIMITFGGILYATSEGIGVKSDAKIYITNALTGLLLVIAAYTILYTINPQILDLKLAIKKPEPLESAPIPPIPIDTMQSDILVRNRLQAAGISINNSNMCASGQTTGCTSLNGLGEKAIDGLIRLKTSPQSTCACSITVTGGTEAGHVSHGVGKPIVDLRRDNALNSYIEKNALYAPEKTALGLSYIVTLPNGGTATFLDEVIGGDGSTDRHWHVVFN